MWKTVLDFVSGIFKPATELIDELHTSEEEKLQLRNSFVKLQNEVTLNQLNLEGQLVDARSKVAVTELTGASWLQRNWRPITMLIFVGLIVLDTFNWLPGPGKLSPEFMSLVKIGLGGYVIGRSFEKAGPAIASSLKGNG
jgi:hypothetical protein